MCRIQRTLSKLLPVASHLFKQIQQRQSTKREKLDHICGAGWNALCVYLFYRSIFEAYDKYIFVYKYVQKTTRKCLLYTREYGYFCLASTPVDLIPSSILVCCLWRQSFDFAIGFDFDFVNTTMTLKCCCLMLSVLKCCLQCKRDIHFVTHRLSSFIRIDVSTSSHLCTLSTFSLNSNIVTRPMGASRT